MADAWGQMTVYLGYDEKKNVIISLRTSAMVMIYTSIECENDCFEGQLVKISKLKISGVVDRWDKTMIILDHI